MSTFKPIIFTNRDMTITQDIPKFTYFKASINCYTFKVPKIKAWVIAQCEGKTVLNLFCGPTMLANCRESRNDLTEEFPANYHMDALECIRMIRDAGDDYVKFDVVLLDPPYSYRKSMEFYKGHLNSKFKQILDIVPEILDPNGKVITFGYCASYMGKCRGFEPKEILVIDHSGAIHATLAIVEGRI